MTEDQVKRLMFDCERKPLTRVTSRTCIARQILLHKPPQKGVWKQQYNDAQELCEGCKKGIELYEQSKKKKGNKKMTETTETTLNQAQKIDGLIVLDLRGEPELLEKIKKWAKVHRRDVQNQILWELDNNTLLHHPISINPLGQTVDKVGGGDQK